MNDKNKNSNQGDLDKSNNREDTFTESANDFNKNITEIVDTHKPPSGSEGDGNSDSDD